MATRTLGLLAGVLLAHGCLTGCRPVKETAAGGRTVEPWFEEIAVRAGIDFIHRSGHETRNYLPEIMGGGAALFDMDNDGFLDLYLVQSGSLFGPSTKNGNRLYRNKRNGTFEDVTEQSGAGVGGYGMGVTAGDFDNDGYTDLYVTGFGHNVLLKNDGHGRFIDVTTRAGVSSSGWSTSAAFIDYNGDGALDLFVTHYLNWKVSAEIECYSLTGTPDYCSPASYDLPSASTLYRNNGNGTFTDVSAPSGLLSAVGNGLGVVPATSTATAVSTSSWQTTVRRIICG